MAYKRKTVDLFSVVADYGHGLEVLCSEYDRKAAIRDLKDYRLNDPGTAYRLKKTREKIK